MVLSDQTIRKYIQEGKMGLEPYDETAIQPASIDVRIANSFRTFENHKHSHIDVKEKQELTELVKVKDNEPFILHPGEFVLGATLEVVHIPDDLVCRIDGKSSLGRLGLIIHSTAGFVDPGFHGSITLELANFASLPITLYAGMPIGQLSFMELDLPAENPYGSDQRQSKYQGQVEPRASEYYKNFNK